MNINKMRANIRMWSIRNYYNDLIEFYAGDDARFNRMVVDGGKSLATAHPQGWAQHIINCSTDAVEFYRDEIAVIYGQLCNWDLEISMPVNTTGAMAL